MTEAPTPVGESLNHRDDETRRRQLRFRSWHRGTREADLLLGSFADAHIEGFDARQLDEYQTLLGFSDPDLYNWMTGREDPPAEADNEIFALLKGHRFPASDGGSR